MLARHFRLPAAAALQPLRQGDFSNLCGLYSVLNAIQLGLWPLRPTNVQLRSLHREGVHFLAAKRKLTSVLRSGMDEHVWVELGDTLVAHANSMFFGALTLKPLFPGVQHTRVPSSRALMQLRKALAKGHPVLCGLGGVLDHYSVLSGYSATRITLFDSSRFSWIEQRNLGSCEEAGKRHWLYAGSVRALIDDW